MQALHVLRREFLLAAENTLLWVSLGLAPLMLWMFFAFWYRGQLVRGKLLELFSHQATLLSETIRKSSLCDLQKVGSINCYTQPTDNIAVFVFRFWTPVGTRFKFWLGVELIGANINLNYPPGVYGSGCAVELYTDNPWCNNDKKAHKLASLNANLDVPAGFEFVEITESSIFVFYKVRDFIGYKPMEEVRAWLKNM